MVLNEEEATGVPQLLFPNPHPQDNEGGSTTTEERSLTDIAHLRDVPETDDEDAPSDSEAPEAHVRRAESGEVTRGEIRTYFPDVVDATGVAPVMSEKEEEEDTKRRQRLFLGIGACVCMAIALGIIIPLVVANNNRPAEIVLTTQPPSLVPSEMPSAAPTLEPVSEQLAFTIEFLRQEEENSTMLQTDEWWNNRSSAPYHAAKWVADQGNYTGEKLLQRFALATLYFSTNRGQIWDECHPISGGCPGQPWLSNYDECTWGFVTCHNSSGMVTELNFPSKGNSLFGTLPPQLSFLSHLQVVVAANNQIQGGSNSLVNSTKNNNNEEESTNRNTHHNNLHVLDQAFYGLSSLEVLNMYGNELSGPLPTRLWTTNPLQAMILSLNGFTGTLPDELSAATNCFELRLDQNYLTGTVPSSLGLLHSSLKHLELEHNRLSGSLPSEFFALTQLTSLILTNNTGLTGDFSNPNRFARLSNLQNFQAAFTQLKGIIPASVYESWTALQTWHAQNASLSGTLSEDLALWNASLKTLWLQNNQFTGVLPSALDALTALEELKLEGNGFTGTISETLCARRGNRWGELAVLTVDCTVECTCCDFYEENCG